LTNNSLCLSLARMTDLFKPNPAKPRKLGDTVFTDRGLRLLPIPKVRGDRWPWLVLIASPFLGAAGTALWHWLT